MRSPHKGCFIPTRCALASKWSTRKATDFVSITLVAQSTTKAATTATSSTVAVVRITLVARSPNWTAAATSSSTILGIGGYWCFRSQQHQRCQQWQNDDRIGNRGKGPWGSQHDNAQWVYTVQEGWEERYECDNCQTIHSVSITNLCI